jgi:hypothetical protein
MYALMVERNFYVHLKFSLKSHLAGVQRGIRELRKESESLRTKNQKLQDELDVLHEAKGGRGAGPSKTSLQKTVEGLKKEIHKLEKARHPTSL